MFPPQPEEKPQALCQPDMIPNDTPGLGGRFLLGPVISEDKFPSRKTLRVLEKSLNLKCKTSVGSCNHEIIEKTNSLLNSYQ